MGVAAAPAQSWVLQGPPQPPVMLAAPTLPCTGETAAAWASPGWRTAERDVPLSTTVTSCPTAGVGEGRVALVSIALCRQGNSPAWVCL